MTRERINDLGEGMIFADIEEISRAYEARKVGLQARIKLRIESRSSEEGKGASKLIDTTVGRSLVYQIMPKDIDFDQINKTMGNKDISKLINLCYRSVGLKDTVIFCDQLMYLGYEYSTLSGASIGVEDFVIPQDKAKIIAGAEEEIREIEGQFSSGFSDSGREIQQGHRHLDSCK